MLAPYFTVSSAAGGTVEVQMAGWPMGKGESWGQITEQYDRSFCEKDQQDAHFFLIILFQLNY
jgi:hypothetical protein